MLGARFNVAFIGMLISGCAVMAIIALAVERRIPAHANAITAAEGADRITVAEQAGPDQSAGRACPVSRRE